MSSSVTGGVLLDDLLVGHTRSEGIENDEDRDVRALDARLTMANLRVNRDALQELLSLHTSHLHEQCMKGLLWKQVLRQEGGCAGTPCDADIAWEPHHDPGVRAGHAGGCVR